MKLFLKKCLTFFIILTFFPHIKSDYYTSVVGLENLLDVEKHFIKAVETYLDNVEKVNKEIESFLDEIDFEKISKNQTNYYEDPVNAFKIIKRFVLDWQHYDDLTGMSSEFEDYSKSITLLDNNYTKPTVEDLRGAARGLTRLQKIYKLDTEDIAQGYLNDYQYSQHLTAHDSFVMARSLYEAGEYLYASEWLIEAMQRLDDMDNEQDDTGDSDLVVYEFPYVTHIEILEFLGAALFNSGNRKLANLMSYKLLEMDPENKVGLANKDLFQTNVMEERRVRIVTNTKPKKKSKIEDLYAKVCSGELQVAPEKQRPLRCRYATNNVPFYFIGPFKMEELNLEPFVAYYHQTIYDGEIEQIIEKVEANVERSRVGSSNASTYDEVRTSKNSWLFYDQNKFLNQIYQRLEDITGLSLASGEALQVANYGIGGHYGPHYDFLDFPDVDTPGQGNRLLTALFYINDVELGGATAFPYLHLAVPPIKNSLVLWYNLHKSLEKDYRTRHAGCPVLKGSKWICNEWFHSVGQEFKRPCELKPDGEISIPYNNII